jgi:hypothetical protein
MLLVESLIHGLVTRSVLSAGYAAATVGTAAEVKGETEIDFGESPEAVERSLDLIEAISVSLKQDVPDSGG